MGKLVHCMGNLVVLKIFVVLFLISGARGEEQCDVLANRFALEDLNTVVDTTYEQLVGTWLSDRCETRSGPQYLLRSYTFREDGTYTLIQHHYWDKFCSSPKLTITSIGLLRLSDNLSHNSGAATGHVRPTNVSLILHGSETIVNSMEEIANTDCSDLPQLSDNLSHNPGAATGYVRPTNVSLILHNSETIVNRMEEIANKDCSDIHMFKWKKHEEYLLYTSEREGSIANKFDDFVNTLCARKLSRSFDEFDLVRIQIRPIYHTITDNPIANFHKLELLLRSTSSYMGNREYSAEFQRPLIKWPSEHKILAQDKYYEIKNTCGICSNIQNSTRKAPPKLVKPELTNVDVKGNWISMRCEIWSFGLYVTRSFNFHGDFILSWRGEYKFYLDPLCTVPKFSLATLGFYTVTMNELLALLPTYMDSNVGIASLTIFDRKMSEGLSESNACAREIWEVDIVYAISNKCSSAELNFTIPGIQYGIIKSDRNDDGATLLHLGFVCSSIPSRITQDPPTSYQDPLVKCTLPEESANNKNAHSNSVNSFRHSRQLFMIISFIIHVLYRA